MPGDRDYVFENVPAILAGGLYIGSRTWPKAGVWTIEYEAPAMLYVTWLLPQKSGEKKQKISMQLSSLRLFSALLSIPCIPQVPSP